MPKLPAMLCAVLLLAGCEMAQAPQVTTPSEAAHSGPGHHSPAAKSEKMVRWEQKWADAKRQMAEARETAVASGRPIPRAVEAEVEEILDRKVEGETDESRILLLQDAVSDALRLASLVAIG